MDGRHSMGDRVKWGAKAQSGEELVSYPDSFGCMIVNKVGISNTV